MTDTTHDIAGLVAFLGGSGHLDGVWFGDRHPTGKGAFWWRRHLHLITALQAERDAWKARADLATPDPMDDPRVKALVAAAGELTSIVEGIQGAFNHGTWRDEKNGMRLKDTTEWCAFYCALAAMKGGA